MGISISRDRQGHAGWWLSSLLTAPVLLQYVAGDAGIPPPVTAALIAANVLAHLRPGLLDELLPPLWRVIEYGDLRRFFSSAFYHVSELHLLMNMTSLLSAGDELETSMGSFEFASMVAFLLGLSKGFTILLSKSLLLLGNNSAYYHQHSAGFSGVLFGMDVVLNDLAGEGPEKYAVCARLLLTQVLIPEASFIGHLGGILAGLTYLCLKRSPGPIAALFSNIADVVGRSVGFARKLVRSVVVPRRRSNAGGGPVLVSAPRETGRGMWRCSACTYDNSQCEDVCQRCSTPHEEHAFSASRQTASQR
ncbi:rhomboid-like protein 14, mitochondrial [Brachypodium distachyon]|uniref:RanBP2-type domain-containing protein n=1 Tax=Brachypodium distachyon TaxID=15368 RepID=I1HEN2_BRADI|nr:rhomboid-like protein 14, mitochondrial [Brachypodium distachyon]KQK03985.1 hypothetical protein BRADI_2g11020v3 [Brachypodium distachyon]|eukprot:XP_014754364.1 rhomboid-like protein 14, mitochondrial [Brachypodium distachyon]